MTQSLQSRGHDVATVVVEPEPVDEGLRFPMPVSQRPAQRERLLVVASGLLVVAALLRDGAEAVERLGRPEVVPAHPAQRQRAALVSSMSGRISLPAVERHQ